MGSSELRDKLWRLLHPRQVEERTLKDRIEERWRNDRGRWENKWNKYEQAQIPLLAAALCPETTPEELCRIAVEYRAFSRPSGFGPIGPAGLSERSEPRFSEPIERLEFALCSHPNFPLQLLGNEVQMTEAAARGFLKNPVFPFLLLECPDFIEHIPGNAKKWLPYFIELCLKQSDLPDCFARTLASYSDKWLALEAKSHVAWEDEEDDAILNLVALEKQVVCLLQDCSPKQRELINELIAYRVLPDWIFVSDRIHSSDFQSQVDIISDDCINDLVRQVNLYCRKTSVYPWRRRQLLLNLSSIVDRIARANTYLASLNSTALRYRMACHPGLRRELLDELAKSVDPTTRQMVASHPNATERVRIHCRQEAMEIAWNIPSRILAGDFRLSYTCSGIFFLTLLYLPNGFAEWTDRRPIDRLLDLDFLYRLGLALRLDTVKTSEHELQRLRARLCEDPNRYVRAAARGELTIPLFDRTEVRCNLFR